MRLVVATRNEGKLKEYRELLAGLPFEVVSLAEYPDIPAIEENGRTFAENAVIKAETVARYVDAVVLADDSGLEVDKLDGRPGVFSARFAGPLAGDEENNRKLLQEMAGVPAPERTARFRAAIAVAVPGLPTRVAEGFCEGVITFEPKGTGGFGYDPLFYVPKVGKTFAEMSPGEKNRISHRAMAMAKARRILEDIASRL